MKINYIRYHNYRCFKDLTIKFDTTSTKNVSLVMGVNGSGKTEMLSLSSGCFMVLTSRVCARRKKPHTH